MFFFLSLVFLCTFPDFPESPQMYFSFTFRLSPLQHYFTSASVSLQLFVLFCLLFSLSVLTISIFSLLLLHSQMTIMCGSFQTESNKEARDRREEPEGRRQREESKHGQQLHPVTQSPVAHEAWLGMDEALMNTIFLMGLCHSLTVICKVSEDS